MNSHAFSETAGEPAFAIELDPGPDQTLIVRLVGALDMDNADALHETLHRALRHRFRRVTVDLSQVTFCDSSGIGALLLSHAEADRIGCRLIAVAPRPFVRRVFELTGVTGLLGLDPPSIPEPSGPGRSAAAVAVDPGPGPNAEGSRSVA
ncbi:STAS domain-containing protein [Plantactinospora sp. B6F1]|uniref:STAS domain-containing protein n=1 Tax=Plantactinospora sp. B6F1 TaxID=3158971 RepID=UPI0032D9082B